MKALPSKLNIEPPAAIAELTVRAVVLGAILGVILGAANVYLGLYAGMTVSASIPAAVLSMGILRLFFRGGTILENNIVQTIAASGESLASGIIFTIPALLIAGVWTEIHFWPTALICIAGGLLGIGFMVPLRRTHIVEDKSLTFPEGVACAEVLKAGDKGGGSARFVFFAIIVGALFKFFTSGFSIFKGTVEWAFRVGSQPFYFGADISAALLGVGYIVGLNVAVLVFLGGALVWLVALPIMSLGLPADGDLLGDMWGLWSSQARFLGVGAMITGGVWSIFSLRKVLVKGLSESLGGYKKADGTRENLPRTEINMSRRQLALLLIVAIVVTFFLYQAMLHSFVTTAVATGAVVLMSFLFVAVASYIVGLVGASNSPVSGMTICALLVTAGLLALFGLTGDQAVIATLCVAGVVCCATCSAGDISQDLKTGYLIGATPRTQQWMEVVGAIIPALVMAPVLAILHNSYGIGTNAPGSLKAPQANLFASLVNGFFGNGTIPWTYIICGMGIGVVVIAIDVLLEKRKVKFRMPVMAFAVGMYLPMTLSLPMLLGGLIAHLVRDKSEAGTGTLLASGLIAGEAITGVVIGGLIAFQKDLLPVTLIASDIVSVAGMLGLFAFFLGVLTYSKRRKLVLQYQDS